VGVNDDESIKSCKGTAPVLDDEERMGAVRGCRWVDEIVPHCPYVMSPEYLSYVIEKYKIDYVVHGDDPCIVDGKDVYQDAKDRGMYREIPRTTGVSTTDIVGRMLVLSRDHHDRARQSPMMGSLMSKAQKRRKNSLTNGGSSDNVIKRIPSTEEMEQALVLSPELKALSAPQIFETRRTFDYVGSRSKFLTTGRMIRIFSQQCKEPKPSDKIVYIDGAWDMFHVGHVETLKAARALGDFLIVGIHNDDMVNAHRGSNYPIMNLNERVLSVLGCRYVDDVLIDAPWEITREMIASLNISIVATGTLRDCAEPKRVHDKYYEMPKQLSLLKTVESQNSLTVEEIVERILSQESAYQLKLKKKSAAENEYYSNRFGFEVKDAVVGSESVMNEDKLPCAIPELQL
jgi:ethanolamine-phosphate cytidylyltransferase